MVFCWCFSGVLAGLFVGPVRVCWGVLLFEMMGNGLLMFFALSV